MTNAIAEPNRTEAVVKLPVKMGHRGLMLTTLEDLWRFSAYVHKSGLAPKALASQEAIFVAIQMGAEVGLTPMAALQNIAVINNRPSLWGDAQLGVVRDTGQLEAFEEWFEEDGKRLERRPLDYKETTAAVCEIKRRGYPAVIGSFSVRDAKRAGLWEKEGPWKQYPFRMLQMRARSFALRDQFGDALRGLRSAEEMRDGQVIDVDAQPSQPSRPLFPPPNRIAERVTESSDTVTDSSVIAPPPPPPEPIEAAGGAESTQVAPEMTAQQAELAAAVASVGCTFNDLVRWADSANWDDFSACADFIDLPGKAVQRLLAAKKGLSEALKRFKENGK